MNVLEIWWHIFWGLVLFWGVFLIGILYLISSR